MSDLTQKLIWNLPWLARYPLERAANFLRRTAFEKKHIVFTVANHFEPAWSPHGVLNIDAQRRRLDEWHVLARRTGEALRDADGTKFRHTNFYPAEQYDRVILEKMAGLQADGLGETEVHLHHGVEAPDNSANLRRVLTDFRDCLADEHRLLSRLDGEGIPRWAFVHGNLALANSSGGRFCGVDDEMEILDETGCYADMTLPSAPEQSQIPVINKIYECGLPLHEKSPHRRGKPVGTGARSLQFPLIFQGPLVFNWTRQIKGIPVPRIEDGALVANQPMDLARFERWKNANVTVRGRSDWIFVKLYCHGFFDYDQSACIGDGARAFFESIIENGERSGDYKVYFASAREAVNMVLAAVDGKSGSPGDHRDYRLKTIMNERGKN
ncbi:MAG: hypothetical protein IPJ30_02415 [Acidobacteria bacterium]|nr:hypothetical protein [Acidobacteriota bacterium]